MCWWKMKGIMDWDDYEDSFKMVMFYLILLHLLEVESLYYQMEKVANEMLKQQKNVWEK